MKKILLLLIVCCLFFVNNTDAQISHITRHESAYAAIQYKGARLMALDEVHATGNEENVFIFPKWLRALCQTPYISKDLQNEEMIGKW